MDNESIHFFGLIHVRADDFLQRAIGEENYLLFKEKGYLDIRGTNNGMYRITKSGEISKIVIRDGFKEFIRKSKKGLVLLFVGYLCFFIIITRGLLNFYSSIAISSLLAALILCSTTRLLYMSKTQYGRTMGGYWKGQIDHKWNLPIEDCIAICYMNIKFDSNRFDRDKKCGNIYIPHDSLYNKNEL